MKRKRIPESKWKWFGNAGHFICARDCQFHLCTLIGRYLISTVGEMWPDRTVREIHARHNDAKWLEQHRHRKGDDFDAAYMARFGFYEIGYKRKFETMVFEAGKPCKAKGCGCGLPEINPNELDRGVYNDAGAATRGHAKMCIKWASGNP